MDYSLRELECFTAVAEELSFTRAARKLHLAQPPLSRHIRALEDRLGARLFDRSARKVSLTPAGALFYDETRGILPQLLRASESVRRAAAGETARLRLGFVSAVLSPELLHELRRFRETHPFVQISVQDSPPSEQLALIAAGSLDGGFVGMKPAEVPAGVSFLPWRKESLACFVPSGHALASRASVSFRDLAGETLIAVSSESAPTFSSFVRQLCRNAGFRPRITFESPRAQAVAVMVAAGAGVAVLPESLARVVGSAASVVPLTRAPSITHVFAHRQNSTGVAMRIFLTSLRAASRS